MSTLRAVAGGGGRNEHTGHDGGPRRRGWPDGDDRGGRAAASRGRLPHHRPAVDATAVRQGGGNPAADPRDLGGHGRRPRGAGRGGPDAGPDRLRQRRARSRASTWPRCRTCPSASSHPAVRDRAGAGRAPGRARHARSSGASSWPASPRTPTASPPTLAGAGRRRRPVARPTSSAATARTASSARALGLTFEGDAFAEEYMLGDVEVDWSMPAGYGDPRDAPDRRRDRRRAGLHPAPGPRALPDVDARARRARHREPAPATASPTGFEAARKPGAAPHPGGARPARPGADDRAQPALVVGVPDQPPHRRPLRRAAGCSSPATPRTSTRRPARRA